MNKKIILGVLGVVAVGGLLWYGMRANPGSQQLPYGVKNTDGDAKGGATQNQAQTSLKNMQNQITIKTKLGDIVIQTYDADAPKASANFVKLAQQGFYNGVIFHRVIPGFMIQGGDPTGTGMGGPGYQFEDELNSNTQSYKDGYKRGVVAMANAGPNTNGSQFFIMHADYPLPHNYTIFGKVISGMEVVDKIVAAPRGANDRPNDPVKMDSLTVEEVK